MIENNIHQIWVGPYEIPRREKMFIQKNKEINNSFNFYLWTDDNLPKLPKNIQEIVDFHRKNENYVEISDVLRLYLIKEYGGIYLDIDSEPISSFDINLIDHDLFVCYHDNNPFDFTIPNEAIASKKNSNIINYICDSIDIKKCTGYHQYWLAEIIRKYLGLNEQLWNQNSNITSNNDVKRLAKERNIEYFSYIKFQTFFIHRRLLSGETSNKEKFKNGDINYTEHRGW